MSAILNLTQHEATKDQIEAGVFSPCSETLKTIRELMTFNSLPSYDDKIRAAESIAFHAGNLQEQYPEIEKAMIGGAPFFMRVLEDSLLTVGIEPVYAFSQRENHEVVEDGKTNRLAIIKHLGFVSASDYL